MVINVGVSNRIMWSTVPKVYEIATNLTIGILIINYLGPTEQGKVSFLISFFMLLSFLPSLGIGPVLSKAISNSKNSALISSRVSISVTTRFLGFLVLLFISISFFGSIRQDLLFLSIPFLLGKLFFSLNIYQNLAEGIGCFKGLAISKLISITLVNCYRLFCISCELDVLYVAWSFFLQDCLQFLCFYILKDRGKYLCWKWNKLKILSVLKSNYQLSFSVVVVGLFTQLDIVMIGLAMGDESAGIYYASTRLTTPMGIISSIVMGACFSYLVKYWESNALNEYYKTITYITISLLLVYFCYAFVVYFIGDKIFFLFFSERYQESLKLFYIHSFGIMFIFLGAVSGRHLIIKTDYKSELKKTSIAAFVNFSLNFVAIYFFKSLTLVAVSSVVSYLFANYLYFYIIKDYRFIKAVNNSMVPITVKELFFAIKKNKIN